MHDLIVQNGRLVIPGVGVVACDIVRHPDARAASDHFPLLCELTLDSET